MCGSALDRFNHLHNDTSEFEFPNLLIYTTKLIQPYRGFHVENLDPIARLCRAHLVMSHSGLHL